jgi:hypothetical protein
MLLFVGGVVYGTKAQSDRPTSESDHATRGSGERIECPCSLLLAREAIIWTLLLANGAS